MTLSKITPDLKEDVRPSLPFSPSCFATEEAISLATHFRCCALHMKVNNF